MYNFSITYDVIFSNVKMFAMQLKFGVQFCKKMKRRVFITIKRLIEINHICATLRDNIAKILIQMKD